MMTRPAARILSLLSAALLFSACGIYSFTGTSIQNDVNTVTINYFEYKAQKVNPSLSNDLTEALKTRFRRSTRLEQVDQDGDLEITGEITGYTNRKHSEDDFENQTFSAYADYDSTNSLDAVESSLCTEIIDKIIEDIFNATVAQW